MLGVMPVRASARGIAVTAGVLLSVLAIGAAEANSPFGLLLAPQTDTASAGTKHTVTATLIAPGSYPGDDRGYSSGLRVLFKVAGANPRVVVATTDTRGRARFTYTGIAAGSDEITACVALDNTKKCDPGERVATADMRWRKKPSTNQQSDDRESNDDRGSNDDPGSDDQQRTKKRGSVEVSVSDVKIVEGNTRMWPPTKATFTVSLSRRSSKKVTVEYGTNRGTASGLSDFRTLTGKLKFPAGTKRMTVTVKVIGDRRVESDEWFRLHLFNADNASINDGNGIGRIVNDDNGQRRR